jgi:hypothetical protein
LGLAVWGALLIGLFVGVVGGGVVGFLVSGRLNQPR